jgi:hypothetical protein
LEIAKVEKNDLKIEKIVKVEKVTKNWGVALSYDFSEESGDY